jgi:hypothetical protein
MCGKHGKFVPHHLVYEQHVKKAGGDIWDTRNRLWIGRLCRCHARHHNGVRRIPLTMVPAAAREFAAELLGPDVAELYWRRYYSAGEGLPDPDADRPLDDRELLWYRRAWDAADPSPESLRTTMTEEEL